MTNTTTIETGCYIDGHHGRYAIDCLLSLVIDFLPTDELPKDIDDIGTLIGFSLTGSDPHETVGLLTGQTVTLEETWDIVSDLYDELTALLPTDDNHAWHWEDGELFYWSISDIEGMEGW